MKSNEDNILSKEEKDEEFFSFEGRFNRLDYFELTVGINSIFSYILMKDYFCLSVFAYFFVFYCSGFVVNNISVIFHDFNSTENR